MHKLYISWQIERSPEPGSLVTSELDDEEKLCLTEEIAALKPLNIILMGVSLKNTRLIFSIIDKLRKLSPESNLIMHFYSLNFSFHDFIYLLQMIKITQFNISDYLATNNYDVEKLFNEAKRIKRKKMLLASVAACYADEIFLSLSSQILSAVTPLQLKQFNIIQKIPCANSTEKRRIFEQVGEIQFEYPNLVVHYIDPMKHIRNMVENERDNSEIHILPDGNVTVNPFIETVLGNLSQVPLNTLYTERLIDFWRIEGKNLIAETVK